MSFFTVSFSRFAPSRAKGGGGQNVSCDFLGGKTYIECPPPKALLEASESGICLVCARFPPKKMTWREQMGGKPYYRWGGVQNRFRGGVFTVCFSPLLSFHPRPGFWERAKVLKRKGIRANEPEEVQLEMAKVLQKLC